MNTNNNSSLDKIDLNKLNNDDEDKISIISDSDQDDIQSELNMTDDEETNDDITSDTSRSSSPISNTNPLSLSGLSLDDSQKKIINDTLEYDSDALSISDCSNITDNESDYNSDDDELDEDYFKKFSTINKQNYINKYHPELVQKNYKEIQLLCNIHKQNDIISDKNHKTIPFLTKFEKTKIIGIRAKQLNNGATAYIPVNSNVMSTYNIAKKELETKKLPFIIARPLPCGNIEYWNLADLEIL